MRAVMARSLRASDVMRLYGKKGAGFGKRVVVIQRVAESDSVKVLWRGLAGGSSDRHVSDSDEGLTFLSKKILHPIEGVWEGELDPGAPGRVVEYNNKRYVPHEHEGEYKKMPTKSKAKKPAPKRSAKAAEPRERASEAELDKLSAKVVNLRDVKNKSWADVCDALDIQPSRARQLYNRGGGEPAERGAAKSKAKAGAKRKGRGKNPS